MEKMMVARDMSRRASLNRLRVVKLPTVNTRYLLISIHRLSLYPIQYRTLLAHTATPLLFHYVWRPVSISWHPLNQTF
jgi:hypothetical protein